jgi:hypothetical protein
VEFTVPKIFDGADRHIDPAKRPRLLAACLGLDERAVAAMES